MKTEDYRSRLDVGSDMDSAKLHEIQEDLIFLAEKFAKINFQKPYASFVTFIQALPNLTRSSAFQTFNITHHE